MIAKHAESPGRESVRNESSEVAPGCIWPLEVSVAGGLPAAPSRVLSCAEECGTLQMLEASRQNPCSPNSKAGRGLRSQPDPKPTGASAKTPSNSRDCSKVHQASHLSAQMPKTIWQLGSYPLVMEWQLKQIRASEARKSFIKPDTRQPPAGTAWKGSNLSPICARKRRTGLVPATRAASSLHFRGKTSASHYSRVEGA